MIRCAADESRIGPARRRGDKIRRLHGSRHILAAIVHRSRRHHLARKEPRLAGWHRGDQRFALVECHLPSRWQVVDAEPHCVEIRDLLHGLADLELIPPIFRSNAIGWNEHMLLGVWLAVHPRPFEEANAADAEQVRDEGEPLAIEGKQHGTARQLTLCLRDAMSRARSESHLGLQHTIRPRDGDEVGVSRPAKSDGDWLKCLSRARLPAPCVHCGPA
jgi:hypothetical protein